MEFPTPLEPALLLRRYKRFLADIALPDGREITVHCPNPGAMTGLLSAGTRAWLSPSAKGAKLSHGWKLAELESGAFVMIDAALANRVVAEALVERRVPGLPAYDVIRQEVALDGDSRIDFRLDGPEGPVWMEVKSVTLARGGRADFPDSRTLRGAKHLRALAKVAEAGGQAVMLYLLSRDDCDKVGIAGDIDPAYAAAFMAARAAGVRMIGLATRLSPQGIWATKVVPVHDPAWPERDLLNLHP